MPRRQLLLNSLARWISPAGSRPTQSVKVPPVSTHRCHSPAGASPCFTPLDRAPYLYSPITLINTRLVRRPSNSP